ncbi:MAG: J domain-containing protein [Desulfovibrionales bacterium]
MSLYEEITAARKILDLPETATKETVKSNYRRLLARWHPDTCKGDKEKCEEMTRRIIAAYRTIQEYIRTYEYSFSEDTVKRHRPPEDWWFERFGEDPVWGKGGPNK